MNHKSEVNFSKKKKKQDRVKKTPRFLATLMMKEQYHLVFPKIPRIISGTLTPTLAGKITKLNIKFYRRAKSLEMITRPKANSNI